MPASKDVRPDSGRFGFAICVTSLQLMARFFLPETPGSFNKVCQASSGTRLC